MGVLVALTSYVSEGGATILLQLKKKKKKKKRCNNFVASGTVVAESTDSGCAKTSFLGSKF